MPKRPQTAALALALATLLACSGMVLTPSGAAACSCAWQEVPAARDEATHVFEGVLVSAVPATDNAPERAVFRVQRVWKGRVSRRFTVQARVGIMMCPPQLDVGQRYIVYTSGPDDAPRIERCARYAAGAGLAAERAALGAPTQTYRGRAR
jgi:hypothetical protein